MRMIDFRTRPVNASDVVNRRWGADANIAGRVREILERVREEGDEAVTTFTRQLDCRYIDSLGLRVTRREINAARVSVSGEFLRAIRVARRNIIAFHRRQLLRSWRTRRNGVLLEQRVVPLARVGICVPGGKTASPSTVLMNALPARIAGVREVVMATPPNREGKISPEVLVAAAECGIDEIYRIGGAQAVGALAFGTESIRRVDKITGPGNAYVATAKQMLYGQVGIDVIAGPTELVIVADDSARVEYVAVDLIAQAEHDESVLPILITTSEKLAHALRDELKRRLAAVPRRLIAQRALDNRGAVVLVRSASEAAVLVNELAPENLEVLVRDPRGFASRIHNAGSIFIGRWSPEAFGDYIAGPNHTPPTGGTARFSSGLSVLDFLKFTNVIELERKAFGRLASHVEVLAEREGLAGHASSVRIRRTRNR